MNQADHLLDNTRGSEGKPEHRAGTARPATGLLRTLIVGCATLAILLVCFSIYQFSQLDPQDAEIGRSSAPRLPDPPTRAPGTSASDDSARRANGAGSSGVSVGPAVVGPARDVQLSIYPREGSHARLEIAVESWQPTGQGVNEFLLVEPLVRMRTADGNAIRAAAREGVLEAERRAGGGLDPRRGRLTGSVLIEIDRLTEAEREALPPEQRKVVDPAQLVRIEMEVVEFDLEYSRVVVPRGGFRLTARDIEVRLKDLELRFDESGGEIRSLRVVDGGWIALRDLGAEGGLLFPGSGSGAGRRTTLVEWFRATLEAQVAALSATPAPEAAAGVAEAPTDTPAAATVTVTTEGTPVFRVGAEEPKAEPPPVRYLARFEDAVRARQLEGDNTLAQIEADVLTVLRSVSDRDKALVREPEKRPAGAAAAPEEIPAASAVELEWTGRLLVDPCEAEEGPCADEVRSRVVAQGSPARLRSPEAQVAGGELRYEPDDGRVWVVGSVAAPAEVRSADQGTLTGARIFSQQEADTIYVKVDGPGTLTRMAGGAIAGETSSPGTADQGGGSSEARFAESMELHGRFVERTRLDFSGVITRQRVRVLERAVLAGGVQLLGDDRDVRSEQMTLYFRPDRGRWDDERAIERVEARGGVTMLEGDDRLTCDEIDLFLAVDAEGRTIPQSATARGDVEAVQARRTIRSAEELVVDFEMVERPAPPFDAAQAYAEAVRRGVDPQSVDWPAVRREHESRRRREVGVRRLRATGDVSVQDPAQQLDLTAATLDAMVVEGQDIERAIISGIEGTPATVRLNTFTVTGHEIRLNVPDEWAEVPGAGRMTFQSYKDLDGRRVTEPVPVAITWTDWMKYQGRENRAVFSGGVHAVSSNTTTFDCRQLMIEFDEVAAGDEQQELTADWWIFSDLVDRVAGGRSEDPWRANARLGREPAFLLATGQALVESSEYDGGTELRTRTRLSGPRLSVNLRRDVTKMLIEGEGYLLLEDFRLVPEGAASDPRPEETPRDGGLFGVDERSGASKTLIEWQRSMWYDFGIDQVRFEGDVSLKHFSGAELERFFGPTGASLADMPAGRSTFLKSQVLTADFLGDAAGSGQRDDQRMGRLGVDQLRQFHASGGVSLQDKGEGLTLSADDLTYERDRAILIVQGDVRRPAHLVKRRAGGFPQSFSAERFFYNLRKGEVEATKAAGGN